MTGGASPVPLSVTTDLGSGGRWTSLRSVRAGREREWLWRNPAVPAAARRAVEPGRAFVDAGGGEECLPSVVGAPERGHDHGDVWCRPWQGTPACASVTSPTHGLTLRRRLGDPGGSVRADYAITGSPGTGLLHAVHLLLEVSPAARVVVPGRPAVAIQDRPVPGGTTTTTWPDGDGVDLAPLGPDDGTARCAVVESDAVEILDGDDRLSMRWGAESNVPLSFVLWRNLGGWPADSPYRSIGIEPMVGAATDVATASPSDLAVLDGAGTLTWWLEISAT